MAGGWLETVHVGMLTAPAGVPFTVQLMVTVPVKPPLGVTVMGTWITPPRHPITNKLPDNENEELLAPITYAALDTALVPRLLTAIALIVSDDDTAIGDE